MYLESLCPKRSRARVGFTLRKCYNRTIGDFLSGPSPKDVISQYQSGIVGLPAMQQYWNFGFHQVGLFLYLATLFLCIAITVSLGV